MILSKVESVQNINLQEKQLEEIELKTSCLDQSYVSSSETNVDYDKFAVESPKKQQKLALQAKPYKVTKPDLPISKIQSRQVKTKIEDITHFCRLRSIDNLFDRQYPLDLYPKKNDKSSKYKTKKQPKTNEELKDIKDPFLCYTRPRQQKSQPKTLETTLYKNEFEIKTIKKYIGLSKQDETIGKKIFNAQLLNMDTISSKKGNKELFVNEKYEKIARNLYKEFNEKKSIKTVIYETKLLKPELILKNKLSIFYWNPNSINAADEFNSWKKKDIILGSTADIIGLCEPFKELECDLYHSIIPDTTQLRQKKYFVQLLIKTEICFKKIKVSRDAILVSVERLKPQKNLLIACIYMSFNPDDGFERRTNTCSIINQALKLSKEKNEDLIIFGDFNLDFQAKPKKYPYYDKIDLKSQLEPAITQLKAQPMHQNGITRKKTIYKGKRKEYSQKSRIDWLLTSNGMKYKNIQEWSIEAQKFELSDHLPFLMEIEQI